MVANTQIIELDKQGGSCVQQHFAETGGTTKRPCCRYCCVEENCIESADCTDSNTAHMKREVVRCAITFLNDTRRRIIGWHLTCSLKLREKENITDKKFKKSCISVAEKTVFLIYVSSFTTVLFVKTRSVFLKRALLWNSIFSQTLTNSI